MKRYLKERLKDHRGVTVVIVALMAVTLLSFTALAIDIGYTLVTRNELQNVADASALAAARQLGQNYVDNGMSDSSVDPGGLIGVAEAVALKNQAAGKYIVVDDGDVIIGKWDSATKNIDTDPPPPTLPDAVRVIARRDGNANGPITMFFARIFGRDTMSVTARATAALTSITLGKPLIPIGISSHRFGTPHCDKSITLYPTNDLNSCGGFHTYTTDDQYDTNTNDMRALLDALTNGTFTPPETVLNVTEYQFWNATSATLFQENKPNMVTLFNAMKALNDSELDDDGDPDTYSKDMDEDSETWTTMVAVYDSPDCGAPTQTIKIVGFAVIRITNVTFGPPPLIDAVIKCNIIKSAIRGGGGAPYGPMGAIPNLVE